MKPLNKYFKNGQHIINGYKLCFKCKEVKTLLDFSYCSNTSTKLQSYCRDCNGDIDRSKYEHHGKKQEIKQPDLFDVNKEFAAIAPEGVSVETRASKIEFTGEEIMAMAIINQTNSHLRKIGSKLEFKPNMEGK